MSTARSTVRRPRLLLLAASALIASSAGVAGAAPAQAAAGCHVTWGSTAEVDTRTTTAPIIAARAGRHDCYDRLVIELRSTPRPGYRIRYVDHVVSDGSGAIVPVRGGARLQVSILAPTYDLAGRPTYQPRTPAEAVSVGGFRTFRQVAYAGSFEGTTTFGLGVRARLPFRAFVLAGPGGHVRLVIDVAHTWA